jgi:hypothetical protein
MSNVRKTWLAFHIPADSPDALYGPPRRYIDVDTVVINPSGSIDISAFYEKYQCRVCHGWFDYAHIDMYIGEADLCDECAGLEAAQHECESCYKPPAPATTIRDERWLCDGCADAEDRMNSYD